MVNGLDAYALVFLIMVFVLQVIDIVRFVLGVVMH